MSSINYTPPPTVKAFIADYRPGELFYSWITGPLGCLPGDSEFLTPCGWKRMDAYQPGDLVAVHDGSGTARFEQADYVKLPATAPFHVFDSGSLVMELSPEHRVLYDDYRGVRQVATAAQCAVTPSRRTIPTTFNLFRPDVPIPEWEIRLRVAFSADGHQPQSGETSFTFRKERKKARLRELLRPSAIPVREFVYDTRPTETIFKLPRQAWTKSLDWVWSLSQRQLAIVLEECLLWDGLTEHEEQRYFTSLKGNADAVQFAAHACGLRATIARKDYPEHPDWRPTYTVQIRVSNSPKNRAMIRAETRISTRASEDGFKYCFATSTGFFVARCRDTVFVTGNSGKTTGLFFKLVYLAKLQAPGTDGVRRSRAVVVRSTAPQLKDTTIKSWETWFVPGVAGTWVLTERTFTLRFDDVECEVMFRPLDTPEDISRVLSLEVTFAIIDEFVDIPRAIIDALSGRLGRYPAKKDGGATNFGMFGSSNPSTEDNWWYDYLHDDKVTQQIRLFGTPERVAKVRQRLAQPDPERNVRYFVQPAGNGPDAENLDNLPGGIGYYENQAKGKSPAWVKQFIEAEWGYSASETPVVKTFSPVIHIARTGLSFAPSYPIIAGFDPGIGGTAMIFGQEDLYGRLIVLGELGAVGMGVTRFIAEKLKPYMRRRFPNATLIVAPDPASANRTQNDEVAVVETIRKHFPVKIETNNHLAKRLDAIENYTSRNTEMGPALVIDRDECPMLVRALAGGWRYGLVARGDHQKPTPDKNSYSHYGDAFGYLARYFHKQFERGGKRGVTVGDQQAMITRFKPASAPRYHFS